MCWSKFKKRFISLWASLQIWRRNYRRTSSTLEKNLSGLTGENRNTVTVRVCDRAVATLIQGSGTSYLDWLWSRNTHYLFDYSVCLTAFVIYFIMTIWTAGSAIAGGVFVPILWVYCHQTLVVLYINHWLATLIDLWFCTDIHFISILFWSPHFIRKP